MQLLGPKAYTNPEVVRELGISMEQQLQITALEDVARGEMQKWFQQAKNNGTTPTMDVRRKKMIELEKSAEARTLKLLSDDQKSKWKDLIGRPYGSLPETSASLAKQSGLN